MPAWALEGGREEMLKRLRQPGDARRDAKGDAALIRDERGGGNPNNVQLARCDWDHSLDGKRLGDVTKGRGMRADDRQRRRDRVLDCRGRRLLGHLPRHRRRGSAAHPARIRRR